MSAAVRLSTDAVVERPRLAPTPGPQTRFLECDADWALYGGAKGGGKTFALLLDGARWRHLPGFAGVVFRRTTPELTDAGALFDKGCTVLEPMGATKRGGNYLDFRWPSGARISMSHMQHESDRKKHEGREYSWAAFDEADHFTELQVRTIDSRLRSTTGIRPYLRMTCNPDRDSWLFPYVEWYLGPDGRPDPDKAGVLRWFVRDQETDQLAWFDSRDEATKAHPYLQPRSFTFIPSLVTDNTPLLEADPEYLGRLQSATRVDRQRWLDGNWFVREGAGMIFARADFRLGSEPPSEVLATVRAWDKAATPPTAKHPDPDWTRGVRVSLCKGGKLWIDDVVSIRGRPGDVLELQRKTAESDGIHVTQVVWQDSGQAGKVDVSTTQAVLTGFVVESISVQSADTTAIDHGKHRSSRAKRAFAKAWAPWVERKVVYVLDGQPWTQVLVSECDGFPDARHDDIVDAISGAFQALVGGGMDWWSLFTEGTT